MKTISALLVVEKKHYEDLGLQIQNLSNFDSVYIFLNDFDVDSGFNVGIDYNSKLNIIKSFNKESLSTCYKRLLDICETDYFTLLSPNHFTHGEIYKYIKTEAEKDYDLIYTDEGFIENEGQENMKVYYYHKPDFDKELLYCQNYISHGAFYKTERAKGLNPFNNDLDFNSDWEFALNYCANIDPLKVKHIPVSLMAIKKDHLSNSRIGFYPDNDETKENSIRFIPLLQEHIRKTNRDSEVSLDKNGYFHIAFKPLDTPKVTIIIPTKDKLELLKPCIDSIIEKTTYQDYDILVIDNNSEEKETLDYLEDLNNKNPKVVVMRYRNEFDFAMIHNLAINNIASKGKSEYVCLLNNDTLVVNGNWLTDMVGIASDRSVGAVGAKLIYPDDTIQHAGVVVGVRGLANHLYHGVNKDEDGYWSGLHLHRNCSAVTGACLLVSVHNYQRVGGMWNMLPIAYNDVDLCLKLLKLNLRNVWSPNALLYHYESKSRGSELSDQTGEKIHRFARDHIYMRYRHGKLINNDPFYNENFSYTDTNYALGNSGPFRHRYGNKEYMLDIPYGLEFVDPTWLPMPSGSKFNVAVRLPEKLPSKIKGLVLPYHQQKMENTPQVAKFHLTVRFPDDETNYELESTSDNGSTVMFNFTGFERDISNISSMLLTLYVVETTSSIHLKWFYCENKYSMVLESVPNKQFRLIMALEDL
jgi:GT2 family glycosyltransferase